jgi:hypothetical protein
MIDKYYPPVHGENKFHCAICGVYAEQKWSHLSAVGDKYTKKNGYGSIDYASNIYNHPPFIGLLPEGYVFSRCEHCSDFTLWNNSSIISPRVITVEQPNPDLSDDIKELYNESATILQDSPRAAAALLRLALQLLLKELGGKGKNIDDDIATIVSNGADTQVQKAMDILRVFGNNSVHPGEINLNEKSELVVKMFQLVNFVADKKITQKKELDKLFDGLPVTIKQQIAKRDKQGVAND